MSDSFPSEILLEILLRLCPKSLVKCTCVCKSWRALITHQGFIHGYLFRSLQLDHRNNGSLFLHLYRREKEGAGNCFEEFYAVYLDNEQVDRLSISKFPLSHLFLEKYSRVIGTCNGLVCLGDYKAIDGANQIIWNPSIRKYVVLPKPGVILSNREERHHRVFFGFGFDSRNDDFKVVRLLSSKRQDNPEVEVYSLSTNCWRSINTRVPPFLISTNVWKTSQMFVNGVIHWVVNCRTNGGIRNCILTFNLAEDTFGELMLPKLLEESPFMVSILAGSDSLAVVLRQDSAEFDGTFFSIWVMKEYGVMESWTEAYHFDSSRFEGISRVLALSSSGEVVLQSWSDAIVLLDPKREPTKHLGLGGFFNAFVGCHFDSLYLINKENGVLSY
ncbi:F-box/kelch-repeat protein At3g23880-like [Neltuma alba]|uniref:F-box/kelch-repeat protein At3g23880-like n=1 Tax=Neltuma alba TaxID=207710 RepID=UPI0010A33E80|nr:F-box/kelch-repeat protein At3g23880-like [Prosopis alba]